MNELARLDMLVREMGEASGKIVKNSRVEFYVKKLRPHIGPELFKLLEDLAEECEFPSPRKIKTHLNARLLKARQQQGPPEMPAMTERERARSDAAAIKSMLWLVYEHGWGSLDFVGGILRRQFPGQDPTAMLRAYMQEPEYSREKVAAWMEAERARGN